MLTYFFILFLTLADCGHHHMLLTFHVFHRHVSGQPFDDLKLTCDDGMNVIHMILLLAQCFSQCLVFYAEVVGWWRTDRHEHVHTSRTKQETVLSRILSP